MSLDIATNPPMSDGIAAFQNMPSPKPKDRELNGGPSSAPEPPGFHPPLKKPGDAIPNGCFEVGIHNMVDSHGIKVWGILIYRIHIPLVPTVASNPRARVYCCTGYPGNFLVRVDDRYRPLSDPNISIRFRIVDQMTPTDMGAADQALRAVPVDNTSDEYSSQVWVLDALEELMDMRLIQEGESFLDVHAMLLHMHQGVGELVTMDGEDD